MTYYVRDTRQIVGNSVLWWAKDCCGYTTDPTKAHVFTQAEVDERDWRDTDVPIPTAIVDSIVQTHVDIQKLRRLM